MNNKFAGEEYTTFFNKLYLTDDVVIMHDSILVKTGIKKTNDKIITVTNKDQANRKFVELVKEGKMFEIFALGEDVDKEKLKIGDQIITYPASEPRAIYSVVLGEDEEEVMILLGSSSVAFIKRS